MGEIANPNLSGKTIDAFSRECLNLFKELSLDSLLYKLAIVASSQSDACYCIVGATNAKDEFTKFHVTGFTSVEMDFFCPNLSNEPIFFNNIHSNIPIRSNKSEEINEFQIFPGKGPFVSSLLFLPIYFGTEKKGTILLLNKIGDSSFSEQDYKSIETLAVYAGVAINNALIYEQSSIRERTLSKRNQDLALLNDLGRVFSDTGHGINSMINQAMTLLMDYLNMEVGEFFLRQDDPDQLFKLEFKSGHSLPTSILGFSEFETGTGIVGRLAENKTIYALTEDDLEVINQKKSVGIRINYFICVPLISSGLVNGAICLGTRLPKGAEPVNPKFLLSIATWAGTAIDNIRLSSKQQRIAVLEERERIGMDLHDGVIQSIYGVGLLLENARIISQNNPVKTMELIKKAIEALNATIRDIRSYIMNLKPERLNHENAVQSMRRLANDFHYNTLVTADFSASVEHIENLSDEESNMFYMICKEALANISKHAHATYVKVSFEEIADRFVLTITDNGQGFDTSIKRKTSCHGVSNMDSRTKNLNGHFEVQSEPGKGTTVIAWLPNIKKE